MANTDKKSKLKKLLIIQILLLVFISIGIAILFKTNLEMTANIFVGIAASLLAWILVKLSWWYIEPDNSIVEDVQKTIIQVLRPGPPIFKQRDEITSQYYDHAYRFASTIYCSGRALNDLINMLFVQSSSNESNLLVESMNKRRLVVRLLLLDPYSAYLEEMDEDGQEVIKKNLKKVYKYCSNVKNPDSNNKDKNIGGLTHFFSGSSLEIKLTKWPLNSTLFYWETSNKDECKMLIGRLYNKMSGRKSEAYEMELPTNKLYIGEFFNNLSNFEGTWDAAYKFLKIANEGGEYSIALNPLPEMKNDQDMKDIKEVNRTL